MTRFQRGLTLTRSRLVWAAAIPCVVVRSKRRIVLAAR